MLRPLQQPRPNPDSNLPRGNRASVDCTQIPDRLDMKSVTALYFVWRIMVIDSM